jgi:hypothetical protein
MKLMPLLLAGNLLAWQLSQNDSNINHLSGLLNTININNQVYSG